MVAILHAVHFIRHSTLGDSSAGLRSKGITTNLSLRMGHLIASKDRVESLTNICEGPLSNGLEPRGHFSCIPLTRVLALHLESGFVFFCSQPELLRQTTE